MKLSLFLLAIFIFINEVPSDQLFTFCGQPVKNKPYSAHHARQSRPLVCISDNPSGSITWNMPLVWSDTTLTPAEKNNSTGPSVSNSLRNNIINCDFTNESAPCFNRWNPYPPDGWRVVKSLESPMGPIFDSRWQGLKEYHIVPGWRDSTFITKFGSSGAIAVSIRGHSNAHFFLCRTLNYTTSFCYWILIGSSDANGAVLGRRCEYDINDQGVPQKTWRCHNLGRSQSRNVPLHSYEWKTFVIKWEEVHWTINIFDPNDIVASFHDYYPLWAPYNGDKIYKVYLDYLKDSEPKRYRVHDYSYTVANKPNAVLSSHLEIAKTDTVFCISLAIGLCSQCDLEVSLFDESNSIVKTETFYGYTSQKAHNLPSWRRVKIRLNIDNNSRPIAIRIVTKLSPVGNISSHHWAIADVHECYREGTVKRVYLFAVQEWTSMRKYKWPVITCQALSEDGRSLVVTPSKNSGDVFQPTGISGNSELCPKYYFGPNCGTECSLYFSRDCWGVTMCNSISCYCTQGLTGQTCDYCTSGHYGYGCQKNCGNCAENSCDRYTGECNACQASAERYYLGPYCKNAIDIPPSPTITYVTETTARLDLPVHDDYKNINASFYFQLQTENSVLSLLPAQTTRPTDPGIRQSLTATFTNLNAGKQYNGRMIMEIQNMKATLKGEWCNFTTKCQSSSSYSVQVDERMLSISKSLNQDVPHNCPDSWYTVELLPSRQTLSGVWPVQLSDLPPGTLFQVQVKGLDGSLQLQKDVKTLEAAPSKVINLEVESVDSTSVELSWYPPVHPNGNITGYKIVVQLRYYKGCLEKKQQLISDFYENKTITISPDVTSWKIVGLKPYGGYYLLVSAYHSKAGLENGTPVATRALRIPTEKFEDLKFIVENSTLTWKDPDCSTVTGPIAGAVVIFSGQSNDVKNFHHSEMTQDLSFELNSFKSKHIIIHGQETYQVKIYVSRDVKGANYNPIACTSLNFTTPPSAPPRVENLDLVEVNSATNWSTLRWQKPLSPRNGDISHYAIVFAGNGQSRSFNVGVDSICPLWKNWLCKDIQNNAVPSKFIKVVAYNKGAEESGPESQIVNRLTEKGADAPQKVSYPCIGNGIVNLTWSHPWRTGGPLVKFIITIDVISTNLSRPLWKNQTTSFITIPVNKSTYQPFYIECIDLLPSTSYALHIQGFGKIYPGGVAHVNVTIPPAFGFDRIESPVVNAEESQINIVIPAILNDTVTNIMDVIVIGPRRCENTEMISDVLKNQLQLDPYTDAWSVATFSTSDRANTQFTIGDGKLYYNIYNNTNCPVFDGSYRYAFLLRDGESSNSVKSEKLLSWTSDPIKIGNDIIMETSPAGWIVPLVLILLIICGVGWFFVRRHRKRSVIIETDTKSDDDLPLPLLEPRKNPRGPHNGMNLLEKQESIEQVGDDVNIRGLVPTPKKIPKKHLSLVKLREFHDYVRNGIASGELVEQYDTFPRGQTQSWDYGQLPHNRSKNRYANLIAYDETRVKLVKLPNEPCSDYINANYVRGYKKNKAYIATQGPKSNTLDDFWRMVWQERVQVICMLANVMEGGKKKCEKYWPDIEKKCEFGGISVDNINHTTFADYTFRIFNVTCGQETRKVEHLHYTAWPDHGVPHYTQSVVTYLKKLLATNTGHGPVVVHCSAGVGRTGTIILCDICLRRAAAEGVVDVFAETEILRTQRPNMVDNRQQYLLAHLTLVECLLTLSTAMPCNETLPAKIQEQKRQLSQQLQRLDECVWQDEALQSSPSKSIEISKGNLHKNRYPELAAVVGQKIQISRYPASDPDSDYIFGVFVDSARNKNNYLASQLPLPSTLNDFWRMVAEFRVELIIALQSPRENDHTCCEFVLRDDTEVKPTSFITLRRKNRIEEDICYSEKILLTDSSGKSSREQPVTVLSLKGWQSGESKQPPKPITLVDFWQYAERIPRGDGPTVVLCDDGVTSCGLYLALSFLLERMGLERECDVSLAIRAIRRSRPDFCTTPEQLEYLYDAAVIYTDYFETYANFT